MKSYKRALRIHHRERLKKSRRYYWGTRSEPLTERQIGMLVNTAALCSCWMCRNCRHVFNEPTMQERKFFQKKLHE